MNRILPRVLTLVIAAVCAVTSPTLARAEPPPKPTIPHVPTRDTDALPLDEDGLPVDALLPVNAWPGEAQTIGGSLPRVQSWEATRRDRMPGAGFARLFTEEREVVVDVYGDWRERVVDRVGAVAADGRVYFTHDLTGPAPPAHLEGLYLTPSELAWSSDAGEFSTDGQLSVNVSDPLAAARQGLWARVAAGAGEPSVTISLSPAFAAAPDLHFDGEDGQSAASARSVGRRMRAGSGASGATGKNGQGGSSGASGTTGFRGNAGGHGGHGRDGENGGNGRPGGPGSAGVDSLAGESGADARALAVRAFPETCVTTGKPLTVLHVTGAGIDVRRVYERDAPIRLHARGGRGGAGSVGTDGGQGGSGGNGGSGGVGGSGGRGGSGGAGLPGHRGQNASKTHEATHGGRGQPGGQGGNGGTGGRGGDGGNGGAGGPGGDGGRGSDGADGGDGASVEIRIGGDAAFQEIVRSRLSVHVDGGAGADAGPAGEGGAGGRGGSGGLLGRGGDGGRGGSGGSGGWGGPGGSGWSGTIDEERIRRRSGSKGPSGGHGNSGHPGQAGAPGRPGEAGTDGQAGRRGIEGRRGSDGERGRIVIDVE